MNEAARNLPRSPRAAAKKIARAFFDFAVSDLPRHQLMNQRTIPGFEPSAEAYAPAVRVLEAVREHLASFGVSDETAIDLNTALLSGLIDQQQANDPGGDRWSRLVEPAIDMWADHIGLPGRTRRQR